MKKTTIVALAIGAVVFAACSGKKTEAPQPAQPVKQTVVEDSAFQQAAAGEYKSADGSRSITLGSDFTVKTNNLPKEYYKWELMAKPEGSSTVITLASKGLEADVTEQATIDTEEGSIIVKNETFRKK